MEDLNFKYFLIRFDNNPKKNEGMFYASNKISLKTTNPKNSICFINYDYKNQIESFNEKENNPLQFPKQLIVEVEKKIPFQFSLNDGFKKIQQTITVKPTVTKAEYLDKVLKIKQHIQLGDIYEMNYCITFEAHDIEINPLEIYKKLNTISTAPYSALAKLDHQYIISSSPELFISKKENVLITKPIKGTAKRGYTKKEDEFLKNALQQSLKERTENVMIVDVARNDLSRIAKPRSVSVEKIFDVETYQQVHQLVSTISCELKPECGFNEIISVTFPMASMTGAPKIRAMQLIDDLELYNRGPYSGCLGYIDENGNFDLSVLIRTIFYDEKKRYLSFSVGSAITIMSNPEEEYEECLLKAKAMMKVLQN